MDDSIGFHGGDVTSSETDEPDPFRRELRDLLYEMTVLEDMLSREVRVAVEAEIRDFRGDMYTRSERIDVEDRIRSVLAAALQRGVNPMMIEAVLGAERRYFLDQVNSPFFDE